MMRWLLAIAGLATVAAVCLFAGMGVGAAGAGPGAPGPLAVPTPRGPAAGFGPSASRGLALASAVGWTAPTNVSNNDGPSGSPVVAVDGQGTVFVAWYDNSQGENWEILYASRPITGAWTPPGDLSNNASYSMVPAIATGHDDTVHVAWQDYGGPRIGYQGTLLYRGKRPMEDFAPFQAISATSGYGGYPEVRDPSLAVDGHDTLHLVWAGDAVGGYDIFYAYKAPGGDWAFPRDVNRSFGISLYPRLVVDPFDTLHVIWQEQPFTSTQTEIYYSYLVPGGTWTPPDNISNSPANSHSPALAVDAQGTLHALWQDYSIEAHQGEIVYVSKPAGGRWSAAENVSRTAGDSAGPTIALDARGTLHVAWYDNTPANWEILYASKPVLGSWTEAVNVSGTSGRSGQPNLVYDNRNLLHLVWADDSPGDFDAFHSSRVAPVFSASYKKAAPLAVPGGAVSYVIVARNDGTSPLSLTMTDTVPAEVTYVAGTARASAGSVSVLGDQIVWQGVVPTGGEARVSFLADVGEAVPVGATIRNRAVIGDGAGNTVTVEATTTIVASQISLPIILSE